MGRSSNGSTSCDRRIPLRLTVLGQSLGDRPRAHVDGREDDEEQEKEKGGCCGDRGDQLHPQRKLSQPTLADQRRRALRCHGNCPPRNPASVTRKSTPADPARSAGQGAALPPRPHHPRRRSRNRAAGRRETGSAAPGAFPGAAAPSPTQRRVRAGPPSFPAAPAPQPVGAPRGPRRDPLAGRGSSDSSPQMEDVRGPGGRLVQNRPQSRRACPPRPCPQALTGKAEA